MAVTPALIKELRERTGAGMTDCKNALVEAEGDLDKAVEVILKKGIVKAASRAGKVATEGEVATWVSADASQGVIVEVNCQTDFVAQLKEELDAATARIAELKAATDLKPEELKAELKAAEQKKGPPEAMWPKVVEGKITKWYSEVTLLGQDNVWEPGAGSIDKVRQELGKKLGGEVKVSSFLRFGLGEGIEKKTEDLAAEVAKTIGS